MHTVFILIFKLKLFFSPDGADYYNVSEVITFNSGSSMGDIQCVNISIIDDHDVECDDIFYISLTTNLSKVIVPMQNESSTVTILPDSSDCK